jgi:voltage-gated potassium channel
MQQRGPFRRFILRHSSELLMWALIAQIIASPAADYHPLAGGILAFFVLLVLLLGTTYMGSKKIVRFVVFPIAGVWMIARLLEAFSDRTHWYTNLAPIAGLALSVSILWAIFERFNSVPRIPRNAIAEAFISYLVLTIAFSQLYWILGRFVPNPFNQPIPESQNGTYLYFSMVTISGVGYGGIAPANPYVRIVAAFETMAGIFYVAVVVARLVSSYRPAPVGAQHSADFTSTFDELPTGLEVERERQEDL